MVRQRRHELLHDFIVVDAVNRSVWCVDGQLIDLLLGQKRILDFDQIFTAQLIGGQIQADSNALVGFSQLKQRQQFEADLGRNMVNHRATSDGFNLKFIVVSHTVFSSSLLGGIGI